MATILQSQVALSVVQSGVLQAIIVCRKWLMPLSLAGDELLSNVRGALKKLFVNVLCLKKQHCNNAVHHSVHRPRRQPAQLKRACFCWAANVLLKQHSLAAMNLGKPAVKVRALSRSLDHLLLLLLLLWPLLRPQLLLFGRPEAFGIAG